MRELKFRAWSTNLKRMFQNDNFSFEKNGSCWWQQYRRIEGIACSETDSLNGVIMQYTGLKDKNGKDVYEGDIVIINTISDKKRNVVFRNGSFKIEYEAGFEMVSYHIGEFKSNELQVVGNIYQVKGE